MLQTNDDLSILLAFFPILMCTECDFYFYGCASTAYIYYYAFTNKFNYQLILTMIHIITIMILILIIMIQPLEDLVL